MRREPGLTREGDVKPTEERWTLMGEDGERFQFLRRRRQPHRGVTSLGEEGCFQPSASQNVGKRGGYSWLPADMVKSKISPAWRGRAQPAQPLGSSCLSLAVSRSAKAKHRAVHLLQHSAFEDSGFFIDEATPNIVRECGSPDF